MTQLEKQFNNPTPADRLINLIGQVKDQQLQQEIRDALMEWTKQIDVILKG